MIPAYDLDPETLSEADRLSTVRAYSGSHRGLQARQVGTVGELITTRLMADAGVAFANDYRTSHDLRLANGDRVEIKTKERSVALRPSHDCSAPAYNHEHQRVEWYVFASALRRDGTKADPAIGRLWRVEVAGVISGARFRRTATLWRKGETDPANGTTFWTDCLNVKVADLRPFANALAYWRSL